MLEILTIEPIAWKTWIPQTTSDFPCMVCKVELASIRLLCEMNTVRLNLSVCPKCALVEPAEIMETIKE